MASQHELDGVYMANALNHGKLSKATRFKVGAILVTTQGVMLSGYNGTPAGTSNECEDRVWAENQTPFGDMGQWVNVTKPEVIHAELNCVLKAAKQGVSVLGGTVYVTLSPCVPCAAMLVQAGISRLLYEQEYRDPSGIDYLRSAGIEVQQFSL